MAQVHVDHPGQMSWFAGKGPARVLGPCTHVCSHDAMRDIAWGPDNEHYVLVECIARPGCNGKCRSWAAEYDQTWSPGKPKFRLHGFQEYDPATEKPGETVQPKQDPPQGIEASGQGTYDLAYDDRIGFRAPLHDHPEA